MEWWASATMTPTSRGKAKVSVVGPFEATEKPIREGKLSSDEWPMEPCGGTSIGQTNNNSVQTPPNNNKHQYHLHWHHNHSHNHNNSNRSSSIGIGP